MEPLKLDLQLFSNNLYTYDANLVTVVVDGRFLTDFAEGEMVSWEKDEDNFDTKVSANGVVGVAKRNNTLGTITIPIMQGSPEVQFLNKLANTGKMFPIWVNSGGDNPEKVGGTKAMVLKPADGVLSDETESREFEVKVFDYTVE